MIQGNTANIVFLKSTDDSMIDTLSKMSGTTHVSDIESKTITRDIQKIALNNNEGKVSYTANTQQRNVIEYNDLAFISPRNSIVFSAGQDPIWNRNETILPMSWRLLKNNIKQPGHKYTFETIPTLSSAREFDVRHNQPNFDAILSKRMKQALKAKQVMDSYQTAYDYSDYDIQTLDPDDYSDEIMAMIGVALDGHTSAEEDPENAQYLAGQEDEDEQADQTDSDVDDMVKNAKSNDEQIEQTAKIEADFNAKKKKKFANGTIAPADLYTKEQGVSNNLDSDLIQIYQRDIGDFRADKNHFRVDGTGSLFSGDGSTYYIVASTVSQQAKDEEAINKAAKDSKLSTYADGHVTVPHTYKVTDDFYKFLATRDNWLDLAGGVLERELTRATTVGFHQDIE